VSDEWEQCEALWWSAIAIKGQLQAYCDVACNDLNELEATVDALCRAKARAEEVMKRANVSVERAERFAVLVGQVLDSETATLEAGERLRAWRAKR
jgi:hypothetical protein